MRVRSGSLAAAALLALVVAAVALPLMRAPAPELSWAQPDLVLRGGFERLPAGGTLVVDRMDRPATPAEALAVRDFVLEGGRLLVARPSPASASLVAALAAGLQLGPGLVFDPDVDADGRWAASGQGDLVAGTVRLAAAHVVLGGEPILATGPFAWHDRGADGQPDLDDPRASWAIGARARLGGGEVVVLGAPEVLQMPEAAGLRAWATQSRPVVLDVAHVAGTDPFGLAYAMAGNAPGTLAAAAAVPILVAVGVALRFQLRRTRPPRPRRPLDLETLEMVAELPRDDARRT